MLSAIECDTVDSTDLTMTITCGRAAAPRRRPSRTASSSGHDTDAPQPAHLISSHLVSSRLIMTNANQRRLFKQQKLREKQATAAVEETDAVRQYSAAEAAAVSPPALSQQAKSGQKRKRAATISGVAATHTHTDTATLIHSTATAAVPGGSQRVPPTPASAPSSHAAEAARTYLRQWSEARHTW